MSWPRPRHQAPDTDLAGVAETGHPQPEPGGDDVPSLGSTVVYLRSQTLTSPLEVAAAAQVSSVPRQRAVVRPCRRSPSNLQTCMELSRYT